MAKRLKKEPVTSETLFEIEQRMTAIQLRLNQMLEESGGEVTEEIENLLEHQLEADQKASKKLDGYAYLMAKMAGEAELLKDRSQALLVRMRRITRLIERMEYRLLGFMQRQDLEKVEGELFTFSRRLAGGRQKVRPLLPAELMPEQFVRVKVEYDLTALYEELERNPGCEYGELLPKEEKVYIK